MKQSIIKKYINEAITETVSDKQIKLFSSIVPVLDKKIEGGFLNNKQAEELQKEIESNYSDTPKFGQQNKDIRQNLFNYDNPLAQKDLNGIDLRIAEGTEMFF